MIHFINFTRIITKEKEKQLMFFKKKKITKGQALITFANESYAIQSIIDTKIM